MSAFFLRTALLGLALAATAPLLAQVPAVTPAFPTNVTGTPGTLLFRQIGLSRVTNIAYHNGFIYTHEVASANPRRWRFTTPSNPASLTIEATGQNIVGNFSDHGTHGHYKVGDWLGGQFAVNIRRNPGAVNQNLLQAMPGFNYYTATQPGDGLTRMYYPWGLAFNWIEYGAVTGYGYLYRGTEANGQPLAQWPVLAQDGVAGNSILLGNLLFITSDESNMGILCYDISPVFQTPAQPPVLLDKLSGPVGAYIVSPWQNYLLLSRRDTNTLDIIDYSDPANLRFVTSINTLGNPARDRGNGLGYIQCQDHFVFADRHKINMETFQTVLELDEMDAGGRPAGSVSGQLDTSQHLMPLGNLLISGGYSVAGADGVGVWIHDAQPDTRAPYVGYHIPRPGQTHFPRGAPISLLIHENLESYTIINGTTVTLRRADQMTPLNCIVSFSYDDVLTITPVSYLEENQTYVVEIAPGGIKDACGNGIVGYSFSFSTGGSVAGGNAAPQITSFAASPSPAPPGSELTFTAAATDAGAGDVLEYRFTFGDAGGVREWSTDPTATHAYAASGHYGVKVQVRDVRTGTPLSTVSQTGTVTIAAAPPPVQPTKSSPIAIHPVTRRVWVVNPDNDSVTRINADSLQVLGEHDLNALLGITGSIDPRNVAVDPLGNAWVTCRDADRVAILSTEGTLVQSLALPHGSAPMGVAITPDGSTAFVTLEGRGQLLRFNTATRTQTGSLSSLATPRAIAITANGSRVLVTRFISGEEFGQVYDVNAATLALTRTIPLHRDRGRDGSSSGRGVPNYVSSITISPDGLFAYFTAVKSNTHRGLFFNQTDNTNDPLDPDNTIRALVGLINLSTHQEPLMTDINTYRIDVDNSESPTSIEFTPSGDYFFVSVQGNNHVAVFDNLLLRQFPTTLSTKTTKGRFATGLAPQGLAFDPATNRLLSADFMGRSVTAHHLGGFLSFGSRNTNRVAIPTITTDKLPPQVLHGKRLFYQAADASGLSTLPTMSLEGYISCASCHVDGQHDGMTWDFTQRGEGMRNTTDLRGRGGVAHGNVHWSANFDEIQDFILDIVNEFGGSEALLPPGEAPHPPLGAPNAGRNAHLDALAAYVASLGQEHLPRSPHRATNGTRTSSADGGEMLFVSQNCISCHGGARFTDSTLGAGLLHDVGTRRTSSGQRLGATLSGLDTPTLLGLWASAPYFHDGSAKTLDEVFRVAGGIVYQAEDAVLSAGVYQPGYPRLNEDSSMHGQMVYLNQGETVTFPAVNGGTTSGLGDIELRWAAPFWATGGTASVTVNGQLFQVNVTRPFGIGQPGDHWQRLRIENVPLTAGATNTLVVTTSTLQDSGFDQLLVTTPDDLQAAYAHRRVLALTPTEQNQLRDYLLQLDGGSAAPPTNPSVALTLAPGQAASGSRPFAEFDVIFSEPVSGLTVGDFLHSGSAASLTTISEGTQYRLRIAGYAAGNVTAQLPADAASALDDSTGNFASNLVAFTYAPNVPDDIAPLSDEFGSVGTLSQWQRNYIVEGWGSAANKLETWDINTSRSGHMRLMPVPCTWFNHRTGPLAFKTVTGDFIATIQLDVRRRGGLPGRPQSDFTWGGLLIRAPRTLTQSSPIPDPGPNVVLPWPPNGSYTTQWNFTPENYIYLASGFATNATGANPNLWHYESKITTNSNSIFYSGTTGVPLNESVSSLQIVRIGQTSLLLRRHGNGPWIIQERYTTSNLPATVQVGLTAYTNWFHIASLHEFHHNHTAATGGNPDIIADVDYFRLRRPPAGLTESALQNATPTGQFGTSVLLSNSALASTLGDPANTAYTPPGQTFDEWLTANLTPLQLVQAPLTAPDADTNGNGIQNLMEFITPQPLALELSGGSAILTLNRNSAARGVTLIIEYSEDLLTWTPIATSVNGDPPTGTATIQEAGGTLRTVIIQHASPSNRTFYRARAVRP